MVIYGISDLVQRCQARELLALAAEEHWHLSPLPRIEAHPLGKPFFPDLPQLHFNLSHSGSLALCALDNDPVGVDIQLVKVWRQGLPERTCCQQELDWLSQQPNRDVAFTSLWSLKEARVKQDGLGLRMPIREISVPLQEHWNGPIFWNGLQFCVYQGENWTAAVCGHSKPPDTICWIDL